MKIKIAIILCFITSSQLTHASYNNTYLTNCSSYKNNMVIVDNKHNNKEIRVKLGEIFQIELPTLGSAGYGWYIDNLNSEYLDIVSEERMVSTQNKIGASVISIWRFIAKKEGHTFIKMDNYRKWEGAEASVDHFIVNIVISN